MIPNMCEPSTKLWVFGRVFNIKGKVGEGIPSPTFGSYNRVYDTYDTLHKCI